MLNLVEHPDENALAAAVADRLGRAAAAGLRDRGRAVLVLAGGGTPVPAYQRLSAGGGLGPGAIVLPGDERWVPDGHADSNHAALSRLFGGTGIELRRLVPAWPGPVPDADFAERNLAGLDTFDAVLLGMGADGHFASLFPGPGTPRAGLDADSRAAAVPVMPDPMPPEAPHARISLTLNRLLDTRCLVLAVRGQTKRAVLDRARDADPAELPVAALLDRAGADLEIHWSR